MKNNILIVFFILSFSLSFSQKDITWKDLSKVKFTEQIISEFDDPYLKPEFSQSVKALEGKQISIVGYFLNIDKRKKIYVISKGPMSACFFCGVGGPETAIELKFDTAQNFKTDAIVIITGTLQFNTDNTQQFCYTLTDCKATPLN